jgi:hypothetical protein
MLSYRNLTKRILSTLGDLHINRNQHFFSTFYEQFANAEYIQK